MKQFTLAVHQELTYTYKAIRFFTTSSVSLMSSCTLVMLFFVPTVLQSLSGTKRVLTNGDVEDSLGVVRSKKARRQARILLEPHVPQRRNQFNLDAHCVLTGNSPQLRLGSLTARQDIPG